MSEEQRCDDVAPVNGDGGAIISRIQDWGFQKIVPVNAAIEITQRCNIRCLHCYNFDRDEPQVREDACATTPELSTAEILQVMADLRAAGCLFLMLTGGEILSHADLFTFMDRARELNFSLQLLTNGTMLKPGVAARIAAYENLQGVSVSVYGATAPVHDGVTQMPGSWRRTWDGIKRLKHLGVVVRVKFIIMRQNAHEVGAMQAMATEMGLPYSIDMNITPRHDGSRGSLQTRIELDQLETLYRGPLSRLVSKKARSAPEAVACNCARGNVAITSTGNVQPCISVPWVAGNIREQAFAEIWKTSPVFERIRGFKLADYKKCAPCEHRAYCRYDRSSAYNTTGDYTNPDPFTCATAELTHRLADEHAAGETPTEERLFNVRRVANAR
ncbi:MAG TPA: radical SAM protein [Polyangia bacterium]|nr:radical SAM protein [Polyangia bacterium]